MKKVPDTFFWVALMGMHCPAHAGDRVTGHDFATRSEVIAKHGIAATSHPLATQIAIDVLKRGGSAVDAAIAADAALGLMEPVSSGIGGDLFAIVWDAKAQRLYGLNAWEETPFYTARERAALAWTEAVTEISAEHVPDAAYEAAREQFSEKELVDLTMAIVASTVGIAWRSASAPLPVRISPYRARVLPRMQAVEGCIWRELTIRGLAKHNCDSVLGLVGKFHGILAD